MKKIYLLMLTFMAVSLTGRAQTIPLVYEVENTGADSNLPIYQFTYLLIAFATIGKHSF